jgi:hypothetical protein
VFLSLLKGISSLKRNRVLFKAYRVILRSPCRSSTEPIGYRARSPQAQQVDRRAQQVDRVRRKQGARGCSRKQVDAGCAAGVAFKRTEMPLESIFRVADDSLLLQQSSRAFYPLVGGFLPKLQQGLIFDLPDAFSRQV